MTGSTGESIRIRRRCELSWHMDAVTSREERFGAATNGDFGAAPQQSYGVDGLSGRVGIETAEGDPIFLKNWRQAAHGANSCKEAWLGAEAHCGRKRSCIQSTIFPAA